MAEFDINSKFNFENISKFIDKSNTNNIYNKILNGTINLTDDILILLIILNITSYCDTYLDLYNNAYNSINCDNTIINEIYNSFYFSVIPMNICDNIINDINLYWLYKLCIPENESINYLKNDFNIKYKNLQIKYQIKKLFNYNIDLVENNIPFVSNNDIIKDNIIIANYTYNLFVDTCKKIKDGYYNNYELV
jgi:hypothetical protein